MQTAHNGARIMKPISLLIAEDNELLRLSLRLSLEGVDELSVVGEAADGPGAVRAAIEHRPSVVLMDIGLPGFDGLVATERIKSATNSRVLILSGKAETRQVLAALKAGADGYCVKEADTDQLLCAIKSVCNHGTWLSDDIANDVISHLSLIDPGLDGQTSLTELELKILNMILEGANLDGIANDLGVHSNQIYAHSQRLMTKLSLSRSDMAESRSNSRHLRASTEHRLSRICPRCHSSWPLAKRNCAYDGAPTRLDNLIGTIFADRYEILSVLGSGAGGTVYKAKHRFMLKMVAIKIMHPNNARKIHALQRFRNEAITSSFLTHPNIVSVLDFGVTEKGLAFMIMDFCNGETLSRAIERRGALTPAQALPLFIQLCDGLEHAHRSGVLHRDLKPSNILVSGIGSEEPVARILDFGTAVLTRDLAGYNLEMQKPGFIYGSPLYMSPEQCRGTKLDASSDIYSLGCLMYETLTGNPPIDAETVNEALMHQIFKDPIHIGRTDFGKNSPPILQGIIMRTLRKEQALRYSSAQELKAYLAEVRV